MDTCVTQVILKVASRCNLSCSYCYVYHKADSTWKQQPALMSDQIFAVTIERVRQHCLFSRQRSVFIAFHGGEPCLIGARKFDAWCSEARQTLSNTAVSFAIQTNGTLIDWEWIRVFQKHRVSVGISMDGPRAVHDLYRVDHQGRGSYDRVTETLQMLREAKVRHGVLCVIPLGEDALAVHRHFLDLNCKSITYLLPHFTHDTISPIRSVYGATPCADFLIPIFDDWWFNSTSEVRVEDMRNMVRIILGGGSQMECLGNQPPSYVFIEPDGDIEGLDTLRICEQGMSKTGLNVGRAEVRAILENNSLHRTAIFEGFPLAQACRACPEGTTCAGGHLPHRYSRARGFDNPSVWCADLLKIFSHLRQRLVVSVAETVARRQALGGQALVLDPDSSDEQHTAVSN